MTEEQRTAAVPIVLVVDHNELVQRFVVYTLHALGYAATTANSAEEAMDVVENNPSLRVLLSDLSLGPIDGPDLARKALRNRPDLKVVLMADLSGEVPFRHTDPVLIKPFNLYQLRIAVEAALVEEDSALAPLTNGERRRIGSSKAVKCS
jgi:CheY-like chemotaxis protein